MIVTHRMDSNKQNKQQTGRGGLEFNLALLETALSKIFVRGIF